MCIASSKYLFNTQHYFKTSTMMPFFVCDVDNANDL